MEMLTGGLELKQCNQILDWFAY